MRRASPASVSLLASGTRRLRANAQVFQAEHNAENRSARQFDSNEYVIKVK